MSIFQLYIIELFIIIKILGWRYWQYPRPFGTTVDNRRTSRGNSGFSELLPSSSGYGGGLKIYLK